MNLSSNFPVIFGLQFFSPWAFDFHHSHFGAYVFEIETVKIEIEPTYGVLNGHMKVIERICCRFFSKHQKNENMKKNKTSLAYEEAYGYNSA